MRVLLIDNGTSLLEKLKNLLPASEITKRWNDVSISDAKKSDLIILSGSRDSSVFWNHGDFENEINMIKGSGKPMIGICFGCELIAYAFGGEIRELAERHTGIREIEIVNSQLSDYKKINVYEHHRWIVGKMPDNFEVLARSKDGPEAIRHRNLPIYGLQFHPENFTEETEGDEIFLGLLNRLTNQTKDLNQTD